MSFRRKVAEIIEGKVVAEIYEKERDRDGVKFYDTVINRRYYDEGGEERRTEYHQFKDLDNIHILLVKCREYIRNALWKNSVGVREFSSVDAEPSEDYAEEN
jgi:hypothetical protein